MKRKRTTVKDYPSNWKTEIVPQVTARACGKCERCGLSHGQTVWLYIKDGKKHWSRSFSNAKLLGNAFPEKQIKVVCAVAHLDHDEWNKDVSMDRLQYLCQKCHLELDYDDNLRRIREMDAFNNKGA